MSPLDACDDMVEEEVAECVPCPAGAGDAGSLHRLLPPVRAALHYSLSSTALAPLEEAQAEPETPPSQLSPAIQASMAAWQSATALLQDLAGVDGAFSLPPPLCTLPGSPPLSGQQEQQEQQQQQQWLLPTQQQWLLPTPDLQPEAKAGAAALPPGALPQHPTWLAALLAAPRAQHAPPQEASSPQRLLGQQ